MANLFIVHLLKLCFFAGVVIFVITYVSANIFIYGKSLLLTGTTPTQAILVPDWVSDVFRCILPFSEDSFIDKIIPTAIPCFCVDTGRFFLLLGITRALYGLYKFCFQPLEYRKPLEDVGYVVGDKQGSRSRREIVTSIRRRRETGDIPPVYPNGWFRLVSSMDIRKGEVKGVYAFGEQLIVCRTESGEARVLDAYCPHLGANLGVGGKVEGNCVQCPFHGWKFDTTDGSCTDIPYSDKVPKFAKLKSWNSAEVNRSVYVWYHAEGLAPTWQVPVIEEIEEGHWPFGGVVEHHINCHIQEIPENGPDVAHLNCLHTGSYLAGSDIRNLKSFLDNFTWQSFDAQYETNCSEPHIALLTLHHKLYLFGKPVPMLDMKLRAYQIGPAIVHLAFESMFGKGAYTQHLLPEEPLLQRVTNELFTTAPTIIAALFLAGECLQIERDIMVWNNKTFLKKPMLVKEEKAIVMFRRWYSQFYSENSPRLGNASKTLDW